MRTSFGLEQSTDPQLGLSASDWNGFDLPEDNSGQHAFQDNNVGRLGEHARGQDLSSRQALQPQPWNPAPYVPNQQFDVAQLGVMPTSYDQTSAFGTTQHQSYTPSYQYSSRLPLKLSHPNTFDQGPKQWPILPNSRVPKQNFNVSQVSDRRDTHNLNLGMQPPGPSMYPAMSNADTSDLAMRPPLLQSYSNTPSQMPYGYSQSTHLQPSYPTSSRRSIIPKRGTKSFDRDRHRKRHLTSGPGQKLIRKRARGLGTEFAELPTSTKRFKSGVSDEPIVMKQPKSYETKSIGYNGFRSGRNLLAIFEDVDDTPRTRYNLRILGGRGASYLPNVKNYPEYKRTIPGGLTLEEICQRFPRHVWGTGLRMFIANGWDGEKVFQALPTEFRVSRAVQRPWNFMQQGFSREVDRMRREDGVMVEQEEDTDEESELLDVPETKHWNNGMPRSTMHRSVAFDHTGPVPSSSQWSMPADEQWEVDDQVETDGVSGKNNQRWAEDGVETEHHIEADEQTDEFSGQIEQIDRSILDQPQYRDLFTIVRVIYAIYGACGVRKRHIRFQKALLMLMIIRARPENCVDPQADLADRVESEYDRVCQQNGFGVESMDRDDLFALSEELVRRAMICLDEYHAREPRDEVEEEAGESGSATNEVETGEPELQMSSDFELFGDFGEPEPLDQ